MKATAPWNMPCMFVTLDVSKLSGWLKAGAWANMRYMFVTRDVSQLEMFVKMVAPVPRMFMMASILVNVALLVKDTTPGSQERSIGSPVITGSKGGVKVQ